MSNAHEPSTTDAAGAPKRQLTLFDSTCIIVGIIIGAGIYESTPMIASCVPNVGWLFAVWIVGGLFSLLGALCYAELATAYPEEGGDYVYLTRAFGRAPGFLFAWSQVWVIRPGSIGAMAYVFARYADRLWPLSDRLAHWYSSSAAAGAKDLDALAAASQRFGDAVSMLVFAAASVLVLTLINILGVREGKWTQNALTTAKVLGLLLIVLAGFFFAAAPGDAVDGKMPAAKAADNAKPADDAGPDAAAAEQGKSLDLAMLGVAMIFVLFTYGGWNEMAYVGAEVRDPKKNILRALVLGTISVTLIYIVVTAAFLNALGFEGVRSSSAVAAEVLGPALGDWAAVAVSVLICVSALGAINGQIFTGARIYYAMGTEHRLFAWLGRWNPHRGTPVSSLLIQAVICLALIGAAGTLQLWKDSPGGFESMVVFTAPAFWGFLLLVGLSVAELRDREPDTPRPYRVPGYPITPILFCLSTMYMLYSTVVYSVEHRSVEALWSIVILLVGVCLAFFDPRPEAKE